MFPADALAAIPDELSAEEAAPLLCAGVTTFNGLRHTRARAGEVVAVLGLGGLGHLGVQFAARMGFETVAVARGPEKAQFATDLGAHHYIDSTSSDVAAGLQRLGGASVMLATVTNGPAMTATIGGLRPRGEWTGPLPHGLDDGLTGILARDAGARSVATSTDLAAADLEMSARSGARPGAVARAVRPLTASAYAPPDHQINTGGPEGQRPAAPRPALTTAAVVLALVAAIGTGRRRRTGKPVALVLAVAVVAGGVLAGCSVQNAAPHSTAPGPTPPTPPLFVAGQPIPSPTRSSVRSGGPAASTATSRRRAARTGSLAVRLSH